MYHGSLLLKHGLHIVPSKGYIMEKESNFTVDKLFKYYLSQVIKFNVNSDVMLIAYVIGVALYIRGHLLQNT